MASGETGAVHSELAKGIIWVGSDLPSEFLLYGTPDVSAPQEAEELAEELSDSL